jgi:phosphoenolpyruvate-protein kinase (PTS system EI component)
MACRFPAASRSGKAHLMSHATLEVSHLVIAPRLVEKEVARFEEALLRVREEFASLKERMQHIRRANSAPSSTCIR